MCCGNKGRKPEIHTYGCGCGGSFRRFHSSTQEKEGLESYRDSLKKELRGVEERLDELGAE
jgi:hypothetical protein